MGRTKCDDCGEMTTTPISGAIYKGRLVVTDIEAVCRECYGKRILKAYDESYEEEPSRIKVKKGVLRERAEAGLVGKSTTKTQQAEKKDDEAPVKSPESGAADPDANATLTYDEFILRWREDQIKLRNQIALAENKPEPQDPCGGACSSSPAWMSNPVLAAAELAMREFLDGIPTVEEWRAGR
ncbi:MAG: hypothetical protein HGA79_08655 [Anaerolineales bacterium]|nr:hypothetical protein [Anaerolineales bacterium]